MLKLVSTLLLMAAVSLSVSSAFASGNVATGAMAFTERYYRSETVEIEMRDGVKLTTEIIRPIKDTDALPVFMVRTPYGAENYNMWGSYAGPERYQLLAEEGYIFVIQETRGTKRSGGEFVLNPPRLSATDPDAVDEATDTYDTLEWLLTNLDNYNGSAGVAGCSYPGYTAVMAALSGHPSMKAVSPQAAMADLYRGDDFYWNGIPLIAAAPFFISTMESRGKFRSRVDMADAYEWFLKAGALKDVQPAAFQNQGESKIWSQVMRYNAFSEYWQARVLAREAQDFNVPALHVFGWYDGEDFPGPYRLFQAVDARDDRGIQRAIVGPWNHCMWDDAGPGDHLGPFTFYSATADRFKSVEAQFFAYHLKGKGSLDDMAQVQVYETGAGGRWQEFERWPADAAPAERSFYLAQEEMLVTGDSPSKGKGSYISDPSKPVPYARRPIGFFSGKDLVESDGKERSLFLLEDQRFVHGRPDVMLWMSEPLSEDLVINGQPLLELYADTTGSDVDWIVQLIDVYPDDFTPVLSGYRRPITRGALRASLREDLTKPKAVKPGKVEKYSIPLEGRSHRFKRGHRILVSLQSTYFPYLARNPQQFIAPADASRDDFRVVTNQVHFGGKFASRITLPVSPNE